jgi:hypothetical protein
VASVVNGLGLGQRLSEYGGERGAEPEPLTRSLLIFRETADFKSGATL